MGMSWGGKKWAKKTTPNLAKNDATAKAKQGQKRLTYWLSPSMPPFANEHSPSLD